MSSVCPSFYARFYNFTFEPYNEYSKLQIALEIIAVVLGIAVFLNEKKYFGFPTGIFLLHLYLHTFAFGLLGEG